MNGEVKLKAKTYYRRKKIYRIAKLVLLILVLILILSYAAVYIINNGYNFTISLDENMYYENKIIIYEESTYKTYRQRLVPRTLDFFDDISETWLPDKLDGDEFEGSHNGDNYFAYTFYIENTGDKVVDYYDEIIIKDVIKNIDDAVRFRIYFDGKQTTYAKLSARGVPEKGTEPFLSDDVIMRQHVENFGPEEIHRYTIVIWLEGTDTECTNNILGGEFRAYMKFNSEFVEE